MNAIQRQTLELAKATGRVDELFDELNRQIDRLLDVPVAEREDVVSRFEHERVVARLNATVALQNAELERLRKAAS